MNNSTNVVNQEINWYRPLKYITLTVLFLFAQYASADNNNSCKRYAFEAVFQNEAKKALGAEFGLPVWSSRLSHHYNWCRYGSNSSKTGLEMANREKALQSFVVKTNQSPCGRYARVAVRQYHASETFNNNEFFPPVWSDNYYSHFSWCQAGNMKKSIEESSYREKKLQDYAVKHNLYKDRGTDLAEEYFEEVVFNGASRPQPKISDVITSNGEPYEIVSEGMQVGSPIYADRTFTYTEIPSFLKGTTNILTFNDDKFDINPDFITLSLIRDSNIFVFFDDRYIKRPVWLSKFLDTGRKVTVNGVGTYTVFSKYFPAGKVVLGGNYVEGEGNYGMYGLAISEPKLEITSLSALSGNPYEIRYGWHLYNGYWGGLRRNSGFDNWRIFELIPKVIDGSTVIRPIYSSASYSNRGQDTISFNVNKPVSVYIIWPTINKNLPKWLDNYEQVNDNQRCRLITLYNYTESCIIFKRIYPTGNIILGENSTDGASGIMYGVAIADQHLEITNITKSHSKSYEIVPEGMQVGSPIYADRTFTYTEIPYFLKGATSILTFYEDKLEENPEIPSLVVNRATTIYLFARASSAILESRKFKSVRYTIKVDGVGSYIIYRAQFPAGEIDLTRIYNIYSDDNVEMYGIALVDSELDTFKPVPYYERSAGGGSASSFTQRSEKKPITSSSEQSPEKNSSRNWSFSPSQSIVSKKSTNSSTQKSNVKRKPITSNSSKIPITKKPNSPRWGADWIYQFVGNPYKSPLSGSARNATSDLDHQLSRKSNINLYSHIKSKVHPATANWKYQFVGNPYKSPLSGSARNATSDLYHKQRSGTTNNNVISSRKKWENWVNAFHKDLAELGQISIRSKTGSGAEQLVAANIQKIETTIISVSDKNGNDIIDFGKFSENFNADFSNDIKSIENNISNEQTRNINLKINPSQNGPEENPPYLNSLPESVSPFPVSENKNLLDVIKPIVVNVLEAVYTGLVNGLIGGSELNGDDRISPGEILFNTTLTINPIGPAGGVAKGILKSVASKASTQFKTEILTQIGVDRKTAKTYVNLYNLAGIKIKTAKELIKAVNAQNTSKVAGAIAIGTAKTVDSTFNLAENLETTKANNNEYFGLPDVEQGASLDSTVAPWDDLPTSEPEYFGLPDVEQVNPLDIIVAPWDDLPTSEPE